MPSTIIVMLAVFAGLTIGVMSAPAARPSDPADMCRVARDPIACIVALNAPAAEGM